MNYSQYIAFGEGKLFRYIVAFLVFGDYLQNKQRLFHHFIHYAINGWNSIFLLMSLLYFVITICTKCSEN